ncbi:B3 domain-containing protein REM5-like [Silene latifolia]|uniref:B3 domain-containing protein REM5-like n=1 Tax=Silene latifolia TaxID=37657 RepID=UPI003D7895C9
MVVKPTPSFFKLYLPEHNSNKLLIPPPFIKYFNGDIPKKVKLRNLQGKLWKVKLEVVQDGRVYIAKGWNEYVRNHSLVRGDFLVFKPLNKSDFHVKVFGIDGVIKEEPVDTGLATEAAADLGKDDVSQILQFSKIYKPYNKFYVDFPKAVIKACDQHGLPQEVTLREEKGCVVESVLRKITDRFRLGGQGFNELCKKTEVKIGDKLDFEVILREGRKIKEIRLKITHKSKKAN